MLTKDLTKFAVRGDRVIPARLKEDHAEVHQDISRVLSVFKSSSGKTESDLLQELEPIPQGNKGILLKGLFKLINDKCDYEEFDGSIHDFRWEIFSRAQELRDENIFEEPEDYRQSLADEFQKNPSELSEQLYSDLPSQKKLKRVPDLSVDQVRNLYNCAQVQSLLLKASEVTLDLTAATVSEMRYVLRQSRFHRLMIEALDQEAKIVKFTGPMTVLDKAQNYGDRLAKFFPHVLTLQKFKFEAEVQIKKSVKRLKIDHKMKLKAPFQRGASYIPEEFESVLATLQKKRPNWEVSLSGQIVPLAEEGVVIPDLTVKIPEKGTFHFEFCHRWHRSGLGKKLEVYEKSDHKIFLGICRSLSKSKDNASALEGSSWFKENGFLFRDFPTSKQIFGLLEPS